MAVDNLFWVLLRRFLPSWKSALIVVSPDTVVRWHRAGFQLYWRLISRVRRPLGRRPVPKEIRELIFKMVTENPTWRAPRIHGELLMLGFDISERSVSRWMGRAPRTPESGQRWMAFLRNHREAIAAMDFFSVPTITFNVLYVFFVLGGASSTSTSPATPPVPGLCSNYARLFLSNRQRSFSCSITMPSMARTCRLHFA